MLLSSVFKILSSCVIKTHDVLSCKWVAKEWLCSSNWKSNMSVKSAWTHWLHFISCVRVGMKPGMRVTAASKTLKLLWMSNIEHGKKTLLMQHHSRAARLSAKKKKKKLFFSILHMTVWVLLKRTGGQQLMSYCIISTEGQVQTSFSPICSWLLSSPPVRKTCSINATFQHF